MKVLQDQNGRSVRRRQCVDGSNRSQRIVTAGVRLRLAGNAQPGLDVPGCQLPLLVVAKLGDFGEGVLVFVGLDPDACKTCSHVFGETSIDFQGCSPG